MLGFNNFFFFKMPSVIAWLSCRVQQKKSEKKIEYITQLYCSLCSLFLRRGVKLAVRVNGWNHHRDVRTAGRADGVKQNRLRDSLPG